jgi:hypothetical protein
LEVTGLDIPVVVDNMSPRLPPPASPSPASPSPSPTIRENDFLTEFAAWPERFYVVGYDPMVALPDGELANIDIDCCTSGSLRSDFQTTGGQTDWAIRFVNQPDFLRDIGGMGGHRIDDLRAWLTTNISVEEAWPCPLSCTLTFTCHGGIAAHQQCASH